ncbi:hypothetical protein CAPTEDRAFT_216040 [Capitella teleta]|uniref:Apple domain-containing protein n=1 Tax=Capitella teleta TaxID=283909 RepID=R7TZY2_CAPTE|nr:hypothetical protein CAPTEDRAFT_216040 [Capitella teleta]|eukprot:ELT96505.1 hypothetical protein CAPTEDRAFT_216040 [Capitella teleta]
MKNKGLAKWINTKNHHLNSPNIVERTFDLPDCKRFCLATPRCRSIDYCSGNICRIKAFTGGNSGYILTSAASCNNYELNTIEIAIGNWDFFGDHLLEGTNVSYTGLSLDDCKHVCFVHPDITCQSISFGQRKCYLSRDTRTLNPSHFTINANFEYYELDRVGRVIWNEKCDTKLIHSNNKIFTNQTAEACMEKCLAEESFQCQNAEIQLSSGKCPSDVWMRRGSYCYLPGCQHGNLTQARDECASHNARLASVEDEEELRFIGWVIVSVANNPESDCGTVDVMYVGLSSSDNQQILRGDCGPLLAMENNFMLYTSGVSMQKGTCGINKFTAQLGQKDALGISKSGLDMNLETITSIFVVFVSFSGSGYTDIDNLKQDGDIVG